MPSRASSSIGEISRILLGALALTLVIGGCALAISGCDGGAGNADAPRRPPPEITFVEIQPESIIADDILPGRISALRIAEVRPQVGGIIQKRLFEEGELVKEGQALYQIDAAPFRADAASARAVRDRAKANLELAEIRARRMKSVTGTGAVSELDIESAETNLALAKAELAQAEATLSRATLNLRYATIRAPIAGRIGISTITEGALVTMNDPQPLTRIQQIDQVYVDIKQPIARYEELQRAFEDGSILRGDALPVALFSVSGEPYPEEGRLLFADISVDSSTNELTLRVIADNPEGRLLPGMFVRSKISYGEMRDALLIPQQALRREPSLGDHVMVLEEGDRVSVRAIQYGRVINGRYRVLSGLKPGDRVIVEGHDRLTPGVAVNAKPFELPPRVQE